MEDSALAYTEMVPAETRLGNDTAVIRAPGPVVVMVIFPHLTRPAKFSARGKPLGHWMASQSRLVQLELKTSDASKDEEIVNDVLQAPAVSIIILKFYLDTGSITRTDQPSSSSSRRPGAILSMMKDPTGL